MFYYVIYLTFLKVAWKFWRNVRRCVYMFLLRLTPCNIASSIITSSSSDTFIPSTFSLFWDSKVAFCSHSIFDTWDEYAYTYYKGCPKSKEHLTLAHISIVTGHCLLRHWTHPSPPTTSSVWVKLRYCVHIYLLPAFEMCDKIENSAMYEVCSVIWFLNAKKVRPIEIYRQIKDVYGETVMKYEAQYKVSSG